MITNALNIAVEMAKLRLCASSCWGASCARCPFRWRIRVDTVITDGGIDRPTRKALEKKGVEIVVV